MFRYKTMPIRNLCEGGVCQEFQQVVGQDAFTAQRGSQLQADISFEGASSCTSGNQCLSGRCVAGRCIAASETAIATAKTGAVRGGEFSEVTIEVRADGERCVFSGQCESGLCKQGTCQGCSEHAECFSRLCVSSKCKKWYDTPIGESCFFGRECQTAKCERNYPGTCQSLGSPNGSPCGPTDLAGDFRCASGYCDQGICSEPLGIGQSCYRREQCASKACDSNTYTCKSCQHGSECITGYCVQGSCRELYSKEEGVSCSEDVECRSRLCIGSCASCNSDEQCGSQLCREGICTPCLSNRECDSHLCVEGLCMPDLKGPPSCVILDARNNPLLDGMSGHVACSFINHRTPGIPGIQDGPKPYQCMAMLNSSIKRYYFSRDQSCDYLRFSFETFDFDVLSTNERLSGYINPCTSVSMALRKNLIFTPCSTVPSGPQESFDTTSILQRSQVVCCEANYIPPRRQV